MPEPGTKAQAIGTQGHLEIETYLKTGKMVLGQHALKARAFIPDPGPDLIVEGSIDDGSLAIQGIPFVGFMDLFDPRPETELHHGRVTDPPGTVEVHDWKFTGAMAYAKTGQEVGMQIPMLAYGEWAARRWEASAVRLSHVYISTRNHEVSKRSILLPRDVLADRWNRTDAIAGSMIEIASEKSADRVPANTKACGAYRGCPHRAYCSGGKEATLFDIFGAEGAKQLLAKKEEKNMSVLNIAGLTGLIPGSVKEQVEKEKEKLLAAEKPVIDPAVAEAVHYVIGANMGLPTLTGEVAKVWAQVTGIEFRGQGLAGAGQLAGATLASVDDILSCAKELKDFLEKPSAPATAEHAGLLPPDAPESNPEKASEPVVESKPEKASEPVVESNPEKASEPVVESNPEKASEPAIESNPEKASEPASEGFIVSSGDIKMSQKCRAYVDELEAAYLAKPVATSATPAQAPSTASGIELYVDAVTEGTTDLSSWVSDLAEQLAARYDAVDIRCAPQDSPLGFGRWKGALAAMVREAALEDGSYFLDTRGSEIAEVAADAMRTRVSRYVRGIR